MKVVALVPAAGRGERMGKGIAKVFLRLGGQSILFRAVSTLSSCAVIAKVIVMVGAEQIGAASDELSSFAGVIVLEGGQTRQESVHKGLQYLKTSEAEHDDMLVLVHDAARCLASSELIRRCIQEGGEWGAVTAALPLSDSIKLVAADGAVQRSLERDGVWAIQTPQVFKFDILLKAHKQAGIYATDDAALVEKIHQVRVVEGERGNIKITTAEDLAIAEKLIGTVVK